MASLHDTAFQSAARDDHLSQLGEAITYTPAGGDPKAIFAVIDRDPRVVQHEDMGTEEAGKATITISLDATVGIAAPARGDKVNFDSMDWFVLGPPLENGDGMADLAVGRTLITERARRNLREEG